MVDDTTTDDAGIAEEEFFPTSPEGMHDILPDDHEYFTYMKKVVRHRCRQAGFRRITTPMLERAETYKKALPEGIDKVNRGMFGMRDTDGNDLVLRSSGTVGIARAYVEHAFEQMPQPIELYYIETFARDTKIKPGQYKQFTQFGFEVIGESDPALDAQVIYTAHKINQDFGIAKNLRLQINNLGDEETQKEYKDALRNYYMGKERSLCFDCQEWMEKDPLQLLSCMEEDCVILKELAPKIDQYWNEQSKEYHASLMRFLDELGIEYTNNLHLVRKLHYYSGTVFEFWDDKKGREFTIGGGGRYDNLIQRLGGDQPTPAVNYAAGMERIVRKMKINKTKVPSKDDLHVFVAQLGEGAKIKCLKLLTELRERGVKAMGAIGRGSMKEQIAMAERFKVPYMTLMGLTEVREGQIIIREMTKGQQVHVPLEDAMDEIIKRIGKENLDTYTPDEIMY
ncbi:histidine--tRNA ligase [Candidatus Peregrinibacteria bacterium CG11_big_fil_rev_8_21_14_0_20_41_10]|nr:MAG: histidine--tRNA ligase [Candidatus Peregrinibacteria bacterium CG11_big_fil_rev_8_21_14_0_20_41_10]